MDWKAEWTAEQKMGGTERNWDEKVEQNGTERMNGWFSDSTFHTENVFER